MHTRPIETSKRLGSPLAIVLAIALVTVPILPGAGANGHDKHYVSPTGTDDEDCTSEAPCASIQHALDLASAGDTVVVRPGVYDEAVTIEDEALTLCGTVVSGENCLGFVCTQHPIPHTCRQPGPAAVLDGTDAQSAFVITATARDVSIENLEIVSGTAQSGIRLAGAAHATVEDNRIVSNAANENTGLRTIGIDAVAPGVHVADNVLSGWIANAIGFWRADGIAHDNTILASRVGVHLGGLADDTQITANTLEGTLYAIRLAGTETREADGVQVHGNALDAANVAPIRIEANNDDVTVDATHNYWAAATCAAIEQRIDDQGGTNTVLIAPYTGPTGTPLPEDPTC